MAEDDQDADGQGDAQEGSDQPPDRGPSIDGNPFGGSSSDDSDDSEMSVVDSPEKGKYDDFAESLIQSRGFRRMVFGLAALILCRYMVDAADADKIEPSRNELHNLLEKPQTRRKLPLICSKPIERLILS